ncbi:MAG: hypothetical protein LBO06_00850 [Bacteroidales bacterium]|jgi:predicted transcriptional regulator|nr:hypothetical protein [Bacteroidales bacterium]
MKEENISHFEQSILRIFTTCGQGILSTRQVAARLSLNDKISRAKIAKTLLKLAQQKLLTQTETGKFRLSYGSFKSDPALLEELNETVMQSILKQFEFAPNFKPETIAEMKELTAKFAKKSD